MQSLPPALAALDGYRQFVPYIIKPSKRPGKMDKIPLGSTTDPSTWMTFAEAAARRADGVGFVFTANDPFWFLDIDGALIDGVWSPLAVQLCEVFAGCAVEVSQSGKGLHVIGSGTPPVHGCRNQAYGLELYHTERFVALTGLSAQGDVRHVPAPHLLDWLVASYFPQTAADARGDGDLSTEPVAEWAGPTDDMVLLRRAMASKSAASAFGAKASFADLWEADPATLGRFFPSSTGDDYGRSEADAALAQHLAFWTGKHGERIERLMRQSGLVRDKWDAREDYYLPRTISNACARQKDVLHDKPIEGMAPAQITPSALNGGVGKVTMVEGETFVTIDNQAQFFDGCTYVVSAHRVLTRDGSMLKPEQFRAKFGGFSFPMDNANQRVTRNAWECFTESQVFRAPKADATMFRPDLPPGYILEEGGYSRVNSYVPVNVERRQGDAAPFLRHLKLLLPVERDREILIAYMAALVQHKGVKFQWAPLIQGAPGNGKTLLTRCLIRAIGERYCHIPSVEGLTEKFNSWLFDRILICVEDVYTQDHRTDVMEILKPMITGEFLSRRGMQTDQTMQNCVANFIFNSNHKGGIRKDANDRRTAPFFCAQQNKEDILRDGMDGAYFTQLYDWLRAGGYAIVTEYLHTYAIPDEFNPASGCQRAPVTSSTTEAVSASLGGVEQEILEVIVHEDVGFRGGFISSEWLARLLERLNMQRRIYPNKRRELLEPLGFVLHPALVDGRAPRYVLPDAKKSLLFVSKDSPHLALTDPEQVCRTYEALNNK